MVAKRKAASTLVTNAVEGEEPRKEEWESHQLVEVSAEDLEKQATAKRLKELKGTAVKELKELIESLGLETGGKQAMIEAIMKHDKKLRKEARAHEEKIRAVVLAKKSEFEMQAVSELAKQCTAVGIKGVLSKPARVNCLLKHWQENDGVDKALAESALEARKAELEAMEKLDLKSLCEQADIDPFISEVMVDRIVKQELALGRFSRPTLADPRPEPAEARQQDVDMVTALLQSEQNRKKDKELNARREEEIASKIKELQSMSVQGLRDELTKKGAEATGKKEDLVKAMCEIYAQEEEVKARKAEIKGMGVQAVKEICASKGLKTGSMNDMMTTLLAHEAKVQEEIRTYDAKFAEVLAEKREDLSGKTAGELKELCASNNLKVGINKEERLDRLMEIANKDGEIDRLVAWAMRKARREALLATDKKELVQRCEQLEADPLTTEVTIERILEHESEFGLILSKKRRLFKK